MKRFLYDFTGNDGIVYGEAAASPTIGESVVLHDDYFEVVVRVNGILTSTDGKSLIISTDFKGLKNGNNSTDY